MNEELKKILSLYQEYLEFSRESRTLELTDLENDGKTKKVVVKGDLDGFMEFLAMKIHP